jgi:DNA-binding Xre family transcriptional regulator
MAAKKERHAWIRDMLADRGLRAKDVATAWGVTDAVVSRFIKTGEPELTFDRATALCRMFGCTMDGLQIRISGQATSFPFADKQKNPTFTTTAPLSADAAAALADLREAANRAARTLPEGYQISVQISYAGRTS